MNDRFKFRAKRLDNNKFVYGYLCFIYIDNEKHCRIYSPNNAMSYDCYTETLGQCTGLKDKNGKLIYEGDLIKEPANKHNLEVFYENGAWQTREYRKNGNREQLLYVLINCYGVEVIGNIHENADLLENEE